MYIFTHKIYKHQNANLPPAIFEFSILLNTCMQSFMLLSRSTHLIWKWFLIRPTTSKMLSKMMYFGPSIGFLNSDYEICLILPKYIFSYHIEHISKNNIYKIQIEAIWGILKAWLNMSKYFVFSWIFQILG